MYNMKTGFIIIISWMFSFQPSEAQSLFISKAEIEFEVKVNVKKTMGNNSWAEMIKESMPEFKTGYFLYTFADNKSVYKFDHWGEKKVPEWMRKNDEENIWYFDHAANRFNMQKGVYGSSFNVEDSIPVIHWKLTNENRVIAGFNCRKAVGKIMDSVYVFAFYTDEIMVPGGPCSINGLPGMILGLTIPRLYASWIAIRVNINNVNTAVIKPVVVKKYFTNKSLQLMLKERTKEWFNEDDPDSRKWIDQFYWNTLL